MTRKDFELIAKTIANTQLFAPIYKRNMAENMADTLATTNPNFDRERFLKACK